MPLLGIWCQDSGHLNGIPESRGRRRRRRRRREGGREWDVVMVKSWRWWW